MIFDFIMIMVIHVLVYNVGRICQKLYFLKIEIINIYMIMWIYYLGSNIEP